MPKRGALTPLGRRKLRGGKRGKGKGISPRAFFHPPKEDVVPEIVNGHQLNKPETKFWRALQQYDPGEWETQVRIYGFDRIGQPDFLNRRRRLVIELNGPFHDTAEGKAKDFVRLETRRQAGFNTLSIKATEVDAGRSLEWLRQNVR